MQLFFELYTHYLDACLYVHVPGMQLLTAGWAAVFVDLQTQLAYVKKKCTPNALDFMAILYVYNGCIFAVRKPGRAQG